jgi:hypothetical protein
VIRQQSRTRTGALPISFRARVIQDNGCTQVKAATNPSLTARSALHSRAPRTCSFTTSLFGASGHEEWGPLALERGTIVLLLLLMMMMMVPVLLRRDAY